MNKSLFSKQVQKLIQTLIIPNPIKPLVRAKFESECVRPTIEYQKEQGNIKNNKFDLDKIDFFYKGYEDEECIVIISVYPKEYYNESNTSTDTDISSSDYIKSSIIYSAEDVKDKKMYIIDSDFILHSENMDDTISYIKHFMLYILKDKYKFESDWNAVMYGDVHISSLEDYIELAICIAMYNLLICSNVNEFAYSEFITGSRVFNKYFKDTNSFQLFYDFTKNY